VRDQDLTPAEVEAAILKFGDYFGGEPIPCALLPDTTPTVEHTQCSAGGLSLRWRLCGCQIHAMARAVAQRARLPSPRNAGQLQSQASERVWDGVRGENGFFPPLGAVVRGASFSGLMRSSWLPGCARLVIL
jgi:hypothetical protein